MKRTQVQIDEATYEALRRLAYEQSKSVSAVVRALLSQALQPKGREKPLSLKDFKFIGAARSSPGKLARVSTRHDDALADALAKELER
jgi:hypothetical protein